MHTPVDPLFSILMAPYRRKSAPVSVEGDGFTPPSELQTASEQLPWPRSPRVTDAELFSLFGGNVKSKP